MTELRGPGPFTGDDGSGDPAVTAALAAFGAGTGSEHAALTALAGSRLLVPVVAAPAGAGASEMSVPTLGGRDGRPALPVFTCVEALRWWQAGARPVPAGAPAVWRAAAGDSCAVVVDIAGPVPVAVDGARLAALAAGQPVPLPHQDHDVQAAVARAAAGQPVIASATAGRGSDGADLAVTVTLAAGCTRAAGDQAARDLGSALVTELGGRLRRGIVISAVMAGSAACFAG